jgi:hypothetical protein
MAERRMADIVRQAQRLGQILVQPQRPRDHAADLRHFQAVRQPHAIMIAIGRDEHLRLVAQAAERDRMDDPVAVALESLRGPRAVAGSSGNSRPRDRAGSLAQGARVAVTAIGSPPRIQSTAASAWIAVPS